MDAGDGRGQPIRLEQATSHRPTEGEVWPAASYAVTITNTPGGRKSRLRCVKTLIEGHRATE